MSLRRASLSVAVTALGLLSACTLRPYYKDVVQPVGSTPQAAEGQTLEMRVVDPATGQPIQGAKVFAGTGRTRLSATSGAEGRISVPMAKALLEENPLVEVVLPKGVKKYQLVASAPAEPAAAPSAPQSTETPAAPDSSATDPAAPASPASPETPPTAPAPATPNPGT